MQFSKEPETLFSLCSNTGRVRYHIMKLVQYDGQSVSVCMDLGILFLLLLPLFSWFLLLLLRLRCRHDESKPKVEPVEIKIV